MQLVAFIICNWLHKSSQSQIFITKKPFMVCKVEGLRSFLKKSDFETGHPLDDIMGKQDFHGGLWRWDVDLLGCARLSHPVGL
jgi:hypothetical protein